MTKPRSPASPPRVAVRVLRPVLRYATGEVVKLRPGQASAFIAAGVAELVA